MSVVTCVDRLVSPGTATLGRVVAEGRVSSNVRNNNNNNYWYVVGVLGEQCILLLPCVMVYYIVSGLFLMFFWCPCMAINVNVQYNGGLLHRVTCLNDMKRFCICSL